MRMQHAGKYWFIKVPGLTIYCEDPDMLFPALMLIDLDKVLQYAPEDPKSVLIVPGEGDYTVTRVSEHEDLDQIVSASNGCYFY